MLKKSLLPALPSIGRDFQKRVNEIATEGRDLSQSYSELTERMLAFAQRVSAIWDEARERDDRDGGEHQQYLRSELTKAMSSNSPAVFSKWLTIGAQSKALLPYKKSIPPQRECLYELALASKEKKPIKKWIDNEALTSTSTVREVMSLRKTKKRKSRPKEFLATVTLAFRSYEEAVTALSDVLGSNDEFKVKSHKAFSEALKSVFDEKSYAKIEKERL